MSDTPQDDAPVTDDDVVVEDEDEHPESLVGDAVDDEDED